MIIKLADLAAFVGKAATIKPGKKALFIVTREEFLVCGSKLRLHYLQRMGLGYENPLILYYHGDNSF